MNKIISILIVIFFVLSCTDDSLTNEQALNILQSEYKQHCTNPIKTSSYSNHQDFSKFSKIFKEAEKNGIASLETRNGKDIYGSYTHLKIKVNKTLRDKYRQGNYKPKYIVASSEITEIQGISISEDKTKATVRFNYKFKPNELHPLMFNKGCDMNILEDEITFTKFDTGWKMDRQKTEEEKLMEMLNQ